MKRAGSAEHKRLDLNDPCELHGNRTAQLKMVKYLIEMHYINYNLDE